MVKIVDKIGLEMGLTFNLTNVDLFTWTQLKWHQGLGERCRQNREIHPNLNQVCPF
jgi:hypothetical protein